MQLNPYLIFNSQCEAAFNYYAKHLNGKIEMMMRFGDSPAAADVPEHAKQDVIHARMTINGQVLMGSDAGKPEHYAKPQGFSVSINTSSIDEAERIFKALADGGTVQMPIQQTFWAIRFGMLTDRFGTPWMVNCENAA